MKPLNYTIIKLTGCLSLGILLSHIFSISLKLSLYAIALAFTGFILTYLLANKQFKKTLWFGITTYMVMLCLGILTLNLHDHKNFEKHYSNHIEFNASEILTITFRIKERLKPSMYHNKYVVNIIKINETPTSGKLLLNVEKDSINPDYQTDDMLVTFSNLESIREALNPNQFDYKSYLEKQYIYHQIFTSSSYLLKLKSNQKTLSGYAASFRELINKRLSTYNFKASELAIINAILLGQRQDMSKDIYNSYANAGAIHILAVSGLHVGLILLLLNAFLKPIEHLKFGKPIKVGLIIFLLWTFAIVAGLSASVTRAVTMFSIVAIAMHLKRQTNIYNTLSISVFILLLCKPMFLFDVGFQMSYLAVFAIVSIQPLLYKLWIPKWKALDYLWQIFTVTIAAQFGVVPISLYYFHQFPGLFFVSNLAIIPFLGLILGLGIVVIALAIFNILPNILANIYGGIISLMNTIVDWVARQETFLLQSIAFDIEHVLICYLLIVSSVLFWKKQTFRTIKFLLCSVLAIQGVWIYSNYKNANHTFTVFHKSRYSLIAEKEFSKLKTYHNLDSLTASKDRVIDNYIIGNFITSSSTDSLTSVYQFQNKIILVIDSLGIYNVKSFQVDYVLLRNSPRINLERMIDSINPKLIIADGSNYKSYVKRWEATCLKRKLPFHHTGTKGAFILKK
ncbi:ComEC/Rec2 family competence protein [Psychroserpens algicola]|uniref:ComEC family competence protein n=1 Tax=Psychroserpens algicola TaxID=1719034 RepID=A0ABT0H918_9FLAO|nr:ComEC family competence protein [Psychroserpens algicola]